MLLNIIAEQKQDGLLTHKKIICSVILAIVDTKVSMLTKVINIL